VDTGSAELIGDFIYRYPLKALSRLLDPPHGDATRLRKLAVTRSMISSFQAEAEEAGQTTIRGLNCRTPRRIDVVFG
jgi:hypothetical protein